MNQKGSQGQTWVVPKTTQLRAKLARIENAVGRLTTAQAALKEYQDNDGSEILYEGTCFVFATDKIKAEIRRLERMARELTVQLLTHDNKTEV